MPNDLKTLTRQRRDRYKKHLLGAHVDEEIYREMKVLAAELLKTTDELVHEAYAMLLDRYNRLEPLRHKLVEQIKRLRIPKLAEFTLGPWRAWRRDRPPILLKVFDQSKWQWLAFVAEK